MKKQSLANSSTENAMHALSDTRRTIDELDATIASLLNERLTLSQSIGALKEKSGLAVKDNSREQEVLEHVGAAASDESIKQSILGIYSAVLKESCRLQEKPNPVESSANESNTTVYFPRILIVGLGLIGAAIAQQIRANLPSTTITAIDVTATTQAAKDSDLIDHAATDLGEAVRKAGLILLCANPNENVKLLEQIAPLTSKRQVIVDVTSTKADICKKAEELTMKADFVGGHPLFGNHKSGMLGAQDLDINDQRFCLVPTMKSTELTMKRLCRWLTDLNLKPVISNADTHDAALAQTSHVIQMIAVALGNMLAQQNTEQELRHKLSLSGPSLQSMARLMSSPSAMWSEIAQQNHSQLRKTLQLLIGELEGIKNDIGKDNASEPNAQGLTKRFSNAARVSHILNEVNVKRGE